jgi:hypothetical protein
MDRTRPCSCSWNSVRQYRRQQGNPKETGSSAEEGDHEETGSSAEEEHAIRGLVVLFIRVGFARVLPQGRREEGQEGDQQEAIEVSE